MKLRRLLLTLCFSTSAAIAEPGFDPVAFSPDKWPGKAPVETQRALQPLAVEFTQARRAHDMAALTSTREKMVAALGVYAGVPEERPVYGQPIDLANPDVEKVTQLWQIALKSQAGRFGWEQAKKLETAPGEGGKAPRLRVSERQIRALLETHEAGLDATGNYL